MQIQRLFFIFTIFFAASIIIPTSYTTTTTRTPILASGEEDKGNEPVYAYHYMKGTVAKESPFSGEVVWTLVDGNTGAIVHSSQNGIVVIRFELSQSAECVDEVTALCLDAKITSVKNTDTHDVNEEIKLTLNPQKNTETVSVVTGPLKGSDIHINLEKHRIPHPEGIAKRFTTNSATFSYDGIKDTLQIKTTSVMESFPAQHVVSVEFTSRHGGYGDRSDQMVTQVLTTHSMRAVVSNGVVISAIMDDSWDELHQQQYIK